MSLPDGGILSAAMRLSNAAYASSYTLNYDPAVRDSLLGMNGLTTWTALTLGLPSYSATLVNGHLVAKGIDAHGYYLSDTSAGFVAKNTDGTLALVFRGTDFGLSPGGVVNGLTDLITAAQGAESDYSSLADLINAFVAYANDPANGVTNILVTGHSLGGELATLFATSLIPGADNISELDPARFPSSRVNVITFASPGIPPSKHDLSAWDGNITNVFHTGDPIYTHQDTIESTFLGNFIHPGGNVPIDLPTVFGTDFSSHPPYSGGGLAAIDAVEHEPGNYLTSILA